MPLPLVREVINKLKDVKYFNKLDLIQEYNNVQIKEDNEQKVVFLTNKILFKSKVVYFVLQLIPQGCIMEKGKRYDNTIGCAVVVLVSISYSRCYNLALSLRSPHVIYLIYCTLFPHFYQYIQYRYYPVSLHFTTYTIFLNFSQVFA